MPRPEESDAGSVSELSVVDRIFTSFVDAVASTDGISDIAERLRITLLDNRDLSEAALEHALFDVQPS